MSYRTYRGRRRRGSGWGLVYGALAAGVLAFGASWYLHVPVPAWIGSRDVKAAAETVTEAGPPPPSADTAEALFVQGEMAFAAGRWAEAAGAYERAVAVRADFEPAHTRWARALLNEHQVSEAIDRARQALAVGPHSAEARAVLALALDWGGQVDRAAQIAREAVDLDRSVPSALGALAEASADQYRLLEADELLAKALKLAPADPDLYRVGQHDDALAAFGRAVELAPQDARAEGGRGMVFYAREEYDPAIASFQRALELDPGYATAYAQLAWIHYARREYDRAEPLFGRAIELDHDGGRVAQYRHALGWIMVSARRSAEAREQFTRALELSPNLQGARDGLKLLQGAGQSPAPAPGRGR